MSGSIFTVHSLDRGVVKWEEHLAAYTPWENHKGMWFKRDDYFAPLGYGGPNGSKMRQLIWYVNRFKADKTHIVTGASIQSPQLSMSAIVGSHYGLPSRQVVYSKPDTILRHVNPRIAYGFGAEFEYASGPYNPILQKKVVDLARNSSLVVEYGITLPHDRYSEDDVRKFHEVGAHQVSNIPDEVICLTYGDGLGNIDVKNSLLFHDNHGCLATVTAVRPQARFGRLTIEDDSVVKFDEKMQTEESWINGGFFILNRKVGDYILGDEVIFESKPLKDLTSEGQLKAFKHYNFWSPVDTLREKNDLEMDWNNGNAAWLT